MTVRSVQIELPLQMRTGSLTAQVLADLSYNPLDPFAVALTFQTDGGRIEWIFSRELLLNGLSESSGDGDVRIWPAGDGTDAVMIGLSSPTGEAVFRAEASVLVRFLQRSLDSVPVGTESVQIDWDVAVFDLLSGRPEGS